MIQVLVPFTTGVEEIELVAVVDILRRADISVCMASLDGKAVTGRSAITLQADAALADTLEQSWDMIVLPGGLPNAHLLRDDALVKKLLLQQVKQQKRIAAICAAPTILAYYGIINNASITSYPTCEAEILALQPKATYVHQSIVQDGFMTTSQGAGTAVDFALTLVKQLIGQAKADAIRSSIVA